MTREHGFRKVIATLLSFSVLWLSLFGSVAQAAMVGTGEMQQQTQMQYDRQQIIDLINQDGVKEQLAALGVDVEEAKDRVNNMTSDELAEVNKQINDLPAGGSTILWVILIIFIVFVVTDVLGATDIFPFIDPIK